MCIGGRPIRSSGLSVSERKMAPLVCHQQQKCADSLTAEAGLACCGPSKTMPQELPVWPTARGTRSAKSCGCLSIYSLTLHAHGHFKNISDCLTSTSTDSPLNYTGTRDKSLFNSQQQQSVLCQMCFKSKENLDRRFTE